MRCVPFAKILWERNQRRSVIDRIDSGQLPARQIENIADEYLQIFRCIAFKFSGDKIRNPGLELELVEQLTNGEFTQLRASDGASFGKQPGNITRLSAQWHKHFGAFVEPKPLEIFHQQRIRLPFMKSDFVFVPSLVPKLRVDHSQDQSIAR